MLYKTALLLCLLLVISACGLVRDVMPTVARATALPAPTSVPPTQTLIPTIAPTMISTPVPPLVAHQWSQSEPLITMDKYGIGDGGCAFVGDVPVDFTLLPNGDLYISDWSGDSDTFEIRTARLSMEHTCRLLNSVDQAGFFDYDSASYVKDPVHWFHPIAGAGYTIISVQAWRANAINLYGAATFIQAEENPACRFCTAPEFPTILPALRNTYKLLSSYQPTSLRAYQPERVGVWIAPGTDPDKWNAVKWPLSSPSVAELVSRMEQASGGPVAILSGGKAEILNEMIGPRISDCGIVVMNGFDIYRVFARPLLPNEFNTSPLPEVSLSCSPADEWIQAP